MIPVFSMSSPTIVICRLFWNDLRRLDISFFFFCRLPLWSCLVLDTYLLGIFVCLFELQNQFHCLQSVCSDSASSSFCLGCLYVSRILSIFPGCSVHWHITLCITLMNFCISVLSVVISPFSFLTLFIGFPLFSIWWACLEVYKFFLSFQKKSS